MRYDNHLNGCIFFYNRVGKGCLQVRAGNNRMMRLDAKFDLHADGSWWLIAGRAKDGTLRPEYAGRFTLDERGRLKGTVALYKLGAEKQPVATLNVWKAETDDGVAFLQLKPRTNPQADRSLPL